MFKLQLGYARSFLIAIIMHGSTHYGSHGISGVEMPPAIREPQGDFSVLSKLYIEGH